MDSPLTTPCAVRRTPGLLSAVTLVALLTAGCGTDPDPAPAAAPVGTPGLRSGGHLDPDLLDAVRAATRDARADGVRMVVTSGWRSKEHQQRLFDEAVQTYGSEEEASRYVATPDTSAHVTGDAVDIGPVDADGWLSQHGADYGLCQTFANEIWHYELATTPGGACPEMLPDGSSRR